MRKRTKTSVLLALLVAAVAGTVLVVVAVKSQEPAPPSLERPVGGTETSAADSVTSPSQVPLDRSAPVSISIPALEVRSEVFPIGKSPDGTLAVPQPGPNLDKAAWFDGSPAPGQPGPSIIEGHVATEENGPSIFFELALLRPGDTIAVEREDGRTAVFTVEALREFPKDEFPTKLVYGGKLGEPTLRLITCSNFDPSVGEHTGNLVVFSTLTKVIEG